MTPCGKGVDGEGASGERLQKIVERGSWIVGSLVSVFGIGFVLKNLFLGEVRLRAGAASCTDRAQDRAVSVFGIGFVLQNLFLGVRCAGRAKTWAVSVCGIRFVLQNSFFGEVRL